MMTLETFKFWFYSIYGFASFAALLTALRMKVRGNSYSGLSLLLVAVICFLLWILFGSRSILVGTDTGLTMNLFTYNDRIGDNREPFINLLIKTLKNFTDAQGYIAFLAALYLGNIFMFVKNRQNSADKFLFFFMIISLFFFKSMGINVVRQGVSLAFFLNALNFYEQKKYRWVVVCCLLAVGFHTTGIIPILLFGASMFLNKRKKAGVPVAILIFVVATVLSALQVNLFSLLPKQIGVDALDVRSAYYNGDDWGYQIGFRPTFFIFNLFFAVAAVFIRRYLLKQGRIEEERRLRLYLIYFLLTSAVFFTAFQIPFSDRWGLFSWIFIPLILEPLFRSTGRNFAISAMLFSQFLFILFEFIIK